MKKLHAQALSRAGRRLALAVGLLVLTIAPANAQSLAGHAGLSFTDRDPFGLAVHGGVLTAVAGTPQLRLGGNFAFYLPQTESDDTWGTSVNYRLTMFELNGLAQYQIPLGEALTGYGLGGLNITRLSDRLTVGTDSQSDSAVKMGLNLGAGIEIPAAAGALYVEARLITGDWDRMVLGGGYRVPLR
jgi:opacity protein-like surface antigen